MQGCMTILAGRNATESGHVIVGHNEDAPGRFVMQTYLNKSIHRGQNHKIKFENDLAELDLPEFRSKLFWSEARTYDQNTSFCDLFLNGNGVIICSNNCAYSKEDKPELTGGIGYGLRYLTAEQATSAKNAVEIATGLIKKYGYASSGRSYAFADKHEIYILQVVHGKNFAVKKVPDDEICVIPNHFTIHEPDEFPELENLINYSKLRGWYSQSNNKFDFAQTFQAEDSKNLDKNIYRQLRALEIINKNLEYDKFNLPFSVKPDKKINLDTIKKILRTHFENTESFNNNGNPHFNKPLTVCNSDTLESSIIEIRHDVDLIAVRYALGRPCNSVYVPLYFGINNLPEGYSDLNPDEALKTHFKIPLYEMDARNNLWFKFMKFQACADIFYPDKTDKIKSEIKRLEEKIERELKMLGNQINLRMKTDPDISRAMMEGSSNSWIASVKSWLEIMLKDLKITELENLTKIAPNKNFIVNIPGLDRDKINLTETKCGPSFKNISEWSLW